MHIYSRFNWETNNAQARIFPLLTNLCGHLLKHPQKKRIDSIFSEAKSREMETLVEIITDKIRRINGIEDTQSIILMDNEIGMSSTSLDF